MSAGKFDRRGKYRSDSNRIYRCRPQTEARLLVLGGRLNFYPTPAPTPGLGSLTLTASRRSLGIIPRAVHVRFTAEPTGKVGDYEGGTAGLRVVVFGTGTYAFYRVGMVGLYLGTPVVLDFKYPEVLR